ncbi:hypothetical protein F4781DRAFT_445370 [Annulohypoxylon bovei var. microspora]|nr:hypothetical protein F4781DRAFT_445370 [Annulohypoxylon bovei var. microspora]
MDAPDEQQLPQGAGKAAEPLAPDPNRFFYLETAATQTTDDIRIYCDALLRAHESTGDDTWLEKRQLTLQRYLVDSEHLAVHLLQGRNAIRAILELPAPHPAIEAPPNNVDEVPVEADEYIIDDDLNLPANSEHNAPVKSENLTPMSPQDRDASEARHSDTSTPHHNDEAANPNAPDHLEQSTALIKFHIHGPKGHSYSEQWTPQPGGAEEKLHIVPATRHNLAIIRRAFAYLATHKDRLAHQLAGSNHLPLRCRRQDRWEEVPHDVGHMFDGERTELELRVVDVGTNYMYKEYGNVFFRDVSSVGDEETWCPLTRAEVRPSRIRENDLVFWVSERVLRTFYYLYNDLESEVD